MSRHDTTSAVIDNILKLIAVGAVVGTVLAAPNAVQLFDKPLELMFRKMDKRERERELRRIERYMRRQGLISLEPDNYQHGLSLTKKGQKRLKKVMYKDLAIPIQTKWDNRWRLVFFDIPQKRKTSRDALTQKLRLLKFQPLQKSAWIHPFPCRDIVAKVTETLEISKYITYTEIIHIDNEADLKDRFKNVFKPR